jgi:hypothetical protein
VLDTKTNLPLIYYSGAVWDKAGTISSSEKWFEYLTFYKQKLENPLKIFIHK